MIAVIALISLSVAAAVALAVYLACEWRKIGRFRVVRREYSAGRTAFIVQQFRFVGGGGIEPDELGWFDAGQYHSEQEARQAMTDLENRPNPPKDTVLP